MLAILGSIAFALGCLVFLAGAGFAFWLSLTDAEQEAELQRLRKAWQKRWKR